MAKYRLIDGYRAKHDLRWDDARLAAMDLQYHDLRPESGLASRVGLERLTTDDEVERAVTEPPHDTRAYFRGKCLQRWASQIVAANWDSMVFDIGGDPLRRVPMMDPTRGTEAHVGRLMAESTTVSLSCWTGWASEAGQRKVQGHMAEREHEEEVHPRS